MPQNETPSTGPSPAQMGAIEALARGATVTNAAAAAGVDRTTVHRWLRDGPEFIAELNRTRLEMADGIRGELRALAADAVRKVGRCSSRASPRRPSGSRRRWPSLRRSTVWPERPSARRTPRPSGSMQGPEIPAPRATSTGRPWSSKPGAEVRERLLQMPTGPPVPDGTVLTTSYPEPDGQRPIPPRGVPHQGGGWGRRRPGMGPPDSRCPSRRKRSGDRPALIPPGDMAQGLVTTPFAICGSKNTPKGPHRRYHPRSRSLGSSDDRRGGISALALGLGVLLPKGLGRPLPRFRLPTAPHLRLPV